MVDFFHPSFSRHSRTSSVLPTGSRSQVQRSESRQFVDRAFDGSLPRFIAAFAGGKPLSRQEAEEIFN